jgi:Tol biopolymer transport system component
LVFLVLLTRPLPVSGPWFSTESYGRIVLSRRLRWVALACAASIVVLLAGCSNNSSNNDTPVITSLFPSSATAGSGALTLNVAGTGFISTSVVYWNNSQRATTYNTTTTELSASITAQDVATAGTAQITIVTPTPGGGTSTAVNFTINPPQNPVPTVSLLTPASTPVGTLPPGGVLSVTGTNFVSGSSVTFNGIARAPTSVNSAGTQLTVPVLASDVAANATIQITVSNPAPGGGVSSALAFTVGTGSHARLKPANALGSAAQLSELVSVGPLGGPLFGGSGAPAISSDGRFVAFYSGGTSLFSQSAFGNVFLRDTCIGAPGCSPLTIAIDLAPDGSAPNAPADPEIAISADGRFVAFVSPATNLASTTQVPASDSPVSPVSNVYVRDLCTGADASPDCAPSTALVSLGVDEKALQSPSGSPSISADGRFIAFTSAAQNLAATPSAFGTALYVRDTCAGLSAAPSCVPQTISAIAGQESSLAGAQPASPSISATGRYIAFAASRSISGSAAEASDSQIFVEDTCLGADSPAGCVRSLAAVSVGADGSELAGVNQSPSISADGRFVAFASASSSEPPKVFLRDTCNGAAQSCTPSTILLAQGAIAPSVNASGRYVSFIDVSSSTASPVTPNTVGILSVYDTCFGAATSCPPQPYQISSGNAAATGSLSTVSASGPAPLSSDGSLIVFPTAEVNSSLPISGRLSDVWLASTPF